MTDALYRAQEIVFTKGDPSDFAYVINSGAVEILDNYPAKPFRLALLSEGEIFGEMGLVDERPRLLTARAVSETGLSKISRDGFIDMVKHQPEDAFRYLRMFFERLRAMNTLIAHGSGLPQKTAAQKLANPVITMFGKTPDSTAVISMDGLAIKRFPFRVGRLSTRREDPLEVNDLSLPDETPFNVSRNHFSIEQNDNGVFIHDRGSFLGTIVNEEVIGGNHKGAWTALRAGENDVIVGSRQSPFRFRINVVAG